jgi:hypothetical protein
MHRRKILLAGLALLVVATVASNRPHADIQLLTHQDGDATPHRMQAAIDLGVVAVSFLYTWTSGKTIG